MELLIKGTILLPRLGHRPDANASRRKFRGRPFPRHAHTSPFVLFYFLNLKNHSCSPPLRQSAAENGARRFDLCRIPIKRRAAGLRLLLDIVWKVDRDGDQDLIHRHAEEAAERVEIVHGGKACAFLPLVDRLRLLKAEEGLQVPNGEAPLEAQTPDVVPGRDQVDHGECMRVHGNRLLLKSEYWNIAD